MGNNLSINISDFLLSYQSVHSPIASYTIKMSPTKWIPIYKGLPSNRDNSDDELIILDNMTFYNINILSTTDPIDEMVYLEIYQDFKGKPIYHWGNIPNHIPKKVLMGVWGLTDAVIDYEQELEL